MLSLPSSLLLQRGLSDQRRVKTGNAGTSMGCTSSRQPQRVWRVERNEAEKKTKIPENENVYLQRPNVRHGICLMPGCSVVSPTCCRHVVARSTAPHPDPYQSKFEDEWGIVIWEGTSWASF